MLAYDLLVLDSEGSGVVDPIIFHHLRNCLAAPNRSHLLDLLSTPNLG